MKKAGVAKKTVIKASLPNLGVNKITVQKNLQETLPSVPLRAAFPRAELGDSGTRMMHGIITEDYNPQLQGIQGIRVFDEMRKSDGTVRAAIQACTLPIRRAEFFVNPTLNDEKSKEIANFVQHALFDWLDITWDDVIRQALLMVSFGVMLFEKVYGVREFEGKKYVTLKKLAPRLPKSILQWELPDTTFGIQQIRQDGILAMIPGSKLLIFVNEREGDNWWGTSMLRAAYKHWYYKNNFYKIDAIAMERQAIGVPMITMPAGYTTDDEKKAAIAAQNLRANESAFLLLPESYKAEFMNMGANTTRDPEKSINHHNKEILQSVLAQFLELGQTSSGGGSRALSSDHSDLFLKSLEAIANTIVSEFNKNLIPELVDLNFSDVKVYPVLDYSKIEKADISSIGTAYGQLVSAGAITPTNEDQQYLRALMGLPPRTQEQLDEEAGGAPTSEEQLDHVNIEKVNNDKTTVEGAAKQQEEKPQTNQDNQDVKTATKKPRTQTKASEGQKFLRKFSDGRGFNSWRPLTFAEQKVNFPKIQTIMDDMESVFNTQAMGILNDAKDSFMSKLVTILESKNGKGVQDLEVQFEAELKTLIKDTMKRAYDYGKQTVAVEMRIPPPNNQDTMNSIDLVADTIAKKTISDLESKAKLTVAGLLKAGKTTYQTAGETDAELQKLIEKNVDNISGIIVGQNINNGRNDVFELQSDDIYALQRSEILDEVTCNFCLSMDARVVEVDDPWGKTDIFHTNCRGIWVEILKDEKNPPAIDGIPPKLADFYSGQTNSLIQPPKPMLKPGSLAEKKMGA